MDANDKKKIAFYIGNFFVVLIVTAATFFKIVEENGLETFSHLRELGVLSVFLLLIIFVINYTLEGLALMLSIKEYNRDFNIKKGVIGHCVGALFSAITPLKMGYFPGLAYVYSKSNVKGENIIKAMAKTGFSNQLLMLVVSVIICIVLLVNPMEVQVLNTVVNLKSVALIGVVYNVALMICYLILVLSPQVHDLFLRVLSSILFKLKIIKDKKDYYQYQKHKMNIIREEISKYLRTFRESLIILGIYLLKNLIFWNLPYIIYMILTGKGFEIEMCLYTMMFTNLIAHITNVVPVPGGSGAAEIGFIAVFSLIFSPNSVLISVMLIWRIFAYFMNIIVGFIVFIVVLYKKRRIYNFPSIIE